MGYAMAQEAEALREKRARIIKAEAETEAAEKLRQAAQTMMELPAALELRRMQMLTEVGRRTEHHDHRDDAERIRRGRPRFRGQGRPDLGLDWISVSLPAAAPAPWSNRA